MVVEELTDLVNITVLEVQRAKDLFKTQILFDRRYTGLAYTKAIDRATTDPNHFAVSSAAGVFPYSPSTRRGHQCNPEDLTVV